MKRKYTISAGIITLMLALSTVCGSTPESENKDALLPATEKVDENTVIIPEAGSPEEELVTIYCTDSTTFEHRTIQGGEAGIIHARVF